MKTLEIHGKNCLISKDKYGVDINGEELHKVILKNMPEELKDNKCYVCCVSLEINIFEEELNIKKSGYVDPNEDEQETEGV